MSSGCHEGTQDQADQISNAASQDRTCRIRKAFALIRHHHGAYHARIVSNKIIILSLYRLGSDNGRNLKSHTDCARIRYLYRPSIFTADWWSSLMSLSGPKQSINFDLFFNFGKDIILPRIILWDSLPWLMIYLVKYNSFFDFFDNGSASIFQDCIYRPSRWWRSRPVHGPRQYSPVATFGGHGCQGSLRSGYIGPGIHQKTGHLYVHIRQILPTSSLADLNLNDTTFLSDK